MKRWWTNESFVLNHVYERPFRGNMLLKNGLMNENRILPLMKQAETNMRRGMQ